MGLAPATTARSFDPKTIAAGDTDRGDILKYHRLSVVADQRIDAGLARVTALAAVWSVASASLCNQRYLK